MKIGPGPKRLPAGAVQRARPGVHDGNVHGFVNLRVSVRASPFITHRLPNNKMYRRPLRTASASLARSAYKRPAPRRFLTTAPPHQTSRSWKNSAIRWGLAGTLLYYYNTSNAFAEEPACMRTCSGILCLCHLANAQERFRPLAT